MPFLLSSRTGQVVRVNPASGVRGPKHAVKTGKTPVLDAANWRKLIDSIPTDTVRDLRCRHRTRTARDAKPSLRGVRRIERACFSEISALSRSPTKRFGSC